MTTTQHSLPMILDQVEVVRVDRLSPSYVRFELGGACLADFGVDGPLYDQRIKLVFPGLPGGPARSAATCAPTRSATWSARARTPGWWSTSSCTPTTTVRRVRAAPGRRA